MSDEDEGSSISYIKLGVKRQITQSRGRDETRLAVAKTINVVCVVCMRFTCLALVIIEAIFERVFSAIYRKPRVLTACHLTHNNTKSIFVLPGAYMKLMLIYLRRLDRPSPSGEDGVIEGVLTRKHEWESTTKKASNRSWDKVRVMRQSCGDS